MRLYKWTGLTCIAAVRVILVKQISMYCNSRAFQSWHCHCLMWFTVWCSLFSTDLRSFALLLPSDAYSVWITQFIASSHRPYRVHVLVLNLRLILKFLFQMHQGQQSPGIVFLSAQGNFGHTSLVHSSGPWPPSQFCANIDATAPKECFTPDYEKKTNSSLLAWLIKPSFDSFLSLLTKMYF
jgi:hypothetical protein